MFYNTNRSTRAALKERELKLNGENIVSDHERLIRLQKQEKLKGLLITKFCRKYGIKKPEKKIENEVKKFVEGEKLTNSDLKKLEDKIRKLLEEEKLKTHNKNLTSLNEINAINNNNNIINRNSPLQSTVINTMPNLPLQENSFRNLTLSVDAKKKKYNNIYEELAALESEESAYQPKIKKIDFSKYGNEWTAMSIYSKLLFDQENKERAIKEKEDQKNLHNYLSYQIEEKKKKIEEEEKLEKEYKKTLKLHRKKLNEIEKEKEKALEEQKLKIQTARLKQIEDDRRRKKLEELREKNYEKKQILKFKKDNEIAEQKRLENEKKKELILKEQIIENEIKKKKLLEKLKKQKEEDYQTNIEHDLIEQKKENERIRYFKRIENNQRNCLGSVAQDEINKRKKEEEEENLKYKYYLREKLKFENEKEKRKEKLFEEKKKELAKFLEMQIEEKKKNELRESLIDKEQFKIFQIDDQKFKDDEKEVQKIIDRRHKKYLNYLKQQIEEKREREKEKPLMNPTEYSMNYKFLEKANEALAEN